MKKTLAILLALVMAVGLITVPAAAEGETGYQWARFYFDKDDDNVLKVDGAEDWINPADELIVVQKGGFEVIRLMYNGAPIAAESIGDKLSYTADDGITIAFESFGTNDAYAVINFNEWDASGTIRYTPALGESVDLACVKCEEVGFKWLNWHWEWNEETQKDDILSIDGISNNDVCDYGVGHKGHTQYVLLTRNGETLGENELVRFRQSLGSSENIGIDFSYSYELQGVIAEIHYNVWNTAATILYYGGELDNGAFPDNPDDNWTYYATFRCGAWEFDFYENPDDPIPVDTWNYTGDGSVIYLRCNDPACQFIDNYQNPVRIHGDGVDANNVAYSIGTVTMTDEDENSFDTQYLKLWFKEPTCDAGNLHLDFEVLEYHENGEDYHTYHRDVNIGVENNMPGLYMVSGYWNDKGEPDYRWDDYNAPWLDWAVPQEYLGDWANFIGLRFYDGRTEDGDPSYSDLISAEELISSSPDLEIIEDSGMLCLVAYAYGDYTISYEKGGKTYTFPVTIRPSAILSVQSANGAQGGTVRVPIKVRSGDLTCNCLGLEIRYDGGAAQCTGVTTAFDEGPGIVTANTDRDGEVILTWANTKDVTVEEGETLATLTFVINNDWGPGDFQVELLRYQDWNGNNNGPSCGNEEGWEVPLALEDGTVRIYEGLAGDFNASGAVDADDAIALLRWIAMYENVIPDDRTGDAEDPYFIVESMGDHMDVNRDGRINLFDVTCLLQYIAGWDVEIYY